MSYGIGLVGWGTVGGGVLDILAQESLTMAQRYNIDFELRAIVTNNPERPRPQDPGAVRVSRDIATITEDDEIQAVLHLVGGTDVAKDICIACLEAGKHVITANKALVCEYWEDLFRIAKENDVCIAYEAAVAGAIPIIAALRDGFSANHIDSIDGILNGTCNYILTQMEEHGWSYGNALEQAQALGYAEADPTLDVNGTDTAHKLALLARIAGNGQVQFGNISLEGIENISAQDIASARRHGLRIKLLGSARFEDGHIALRVCPTLLPLEHQLSAVTGNFNAVQVVGHACGPMLLVGQGAGALPTASAVLADLIDVAVGRYQATSAYYAFFRNGKALNIMDQVDEEQAHFVRFACPDRPGVLAGICSNFSERDINISAIHQDDPADGQATIEVITRPCSNGSIHDVVGLIEHSGLTNGVTQVLRCAD